MEHFKSVKSLVEKTPNWSYNNLQNTDPAGVILDGEVALKCDLVIALYKSQNVYVAWNGVIHDESIVKGDTHKFSIKNPSAYIEGVDESTVIVPCYKNLRGSGRNEKVVLIKPEFIMEFLNDPFSYLMPDKKDSGYDPYCLFAIPQDRQPKTIKEFEEYNRLWVEKERKYHSCSAANRDSGFRSRVFSKYKTPRCIVCGIDFDPMLQAAHIKAVKNGGSDDPENGVCLCANHHLLFDRGYFKIDPTTNEVRDIDEEIKTYMEY